MSAPDPEQPQRSQRLPHQQLAERGQHQAAPLVNRNGVREKERDATACAPTPRPSCHRLPGDRCAAISPFQDRGSTSPPVARNIVAGSHHRRCSTDEGLRRARLPRTFARAGPRATVDQPWLGGSHSLRRVSTVP